MQTKKLLVLTVVLSMLIGIMPWTIVQATGTFSGTLDFEDVAEGTSADEISGITLSGNGTAKITKDDFGTKAIKMSTPSQLKFNFPDTTDKTVTVSYRFRSENHTQNTNLYEFGTLKSGESPLIKSVIYNTNLLTYFGGTNPAYNKGIVSVATSESYHTVKYVINTVDKVFNVFVDGVAVTPWTGKWLPWDNTLSSVDTLVFNQPYSGGIYWIDDVEVEEGMKASWTIPSNNSADVSISTKTLYAKFDSAVDTSLIGVFEGTTKIGATVAQDSSENLVKISLTDSLEAGKTYTVSSDGSAIFKFTTATAPKSILYSQDFNDVSNLENLKGWTFLAGSGSTIDVTNDTTTGNKALKMTIGNATTANYAKVYFPQSTASRVKVSYTLRFQNHSRWSLENEGFGTIMNGSNLVNKNMLYGNGYKAYGSYNSAANNSNLLVISESDKEPKKFETYIDFTNNKEKVYVNGVLTANDFVLQGTEQNADSMMFRVRYNSSGNGTSSDGTDLNNGVYWIDDIKVENLDTFYCESISPSDGSEDISTGTNVNIAFNDFIDESTVSASTVSLKNADDASVNCTYSVNGNRIIVTPNARLKSSTEYTISVNGVKGTNGFTANAFTSSFTTSEPKPVNYTENFEKYQKDNTAENIDGIKASNNAKAVIDVDKNGNKSLKVTSDTDLTLDFENTLSDKVEISYKYKVTSYTKSYGMFDFGAVYNGDQKAVYAIDYYGYIRGFFRGNASSNAAIGPFDVATDYHTVKYIINTKTKLFDVYFDGVAKTNYTGTWQLYDTSVSSVNKLYFQVRNASVMYFDDITIKDLTLDFASVTPQNNEEEVKLDKNIVMQFNDNISQDCLSSQYFTLYANDSVISPEEYTIEKTTDNSVTVVPKNGWNYATTYKLKVSKEINKGKDGYISPANDLETTFKTQASFKETLKYVYDFENYNEGDVPTLTDDLGWELTVPSGASIKVVKDEVTNSKALQITNSNIYSAVALLKFPTVSNNKVKVSYDFRAKNHSIQAGSNGFGSIMNNGLLVTKAWLYTNNLTYFGYGSAIANQALISGLNTAGNIWYTVAQDMNLKNGQIAMSVDDVVKGNRVTQNQVSSIDSLYFSASKAQYTPLNGTADDGTTENAGVYLLDNIVIEAKIAPTVSEILPKNGDNNVKPGDDVTVKFNCPVVESTLSNIEIYKNNTLLSSSDYSIHSVTTGVTTAYITIEDMDYDSEYKIVVDGVKGAGASQLDMDSPFTSTFKTMKKIALQDVTVTNGATDNEIEISAVIANNGADVNQSYNVVGAIYDASGTLCNVAYREVKTVALNNAAVETFTMDKPEGYTTAYKVKVMVWNDTMPLDKVYESALPGSRTYGYDVYTDSTKPLNVTFLGGSITEQKNYSDSVVADFGWNGRETAPTYVNVGVGGTNSELGLYRLQKDVISKNPDIVFLEYAVNDGGMTISGVTMENIVRRLMKLDHQPVVILLYMPTASSQIDYPTIDNYFNPIAEHYGLGAVDVRKYIVNGVANGEYTWDKTDTSGAVLLSADNVHPNAAGGRIYADYILSEFNNNTSTYFKKMTENKNVLFNDFEYVKPRLIPASDATYAGKWTNTTMCVNRLEAGTMTSSDSGSTVTLTFTGSSVGLYLPKTPTGCTASFSIDDGTYTGKINSQNGASMPMFENIQRNMPYKKHTLTITVDPAVGTLNTFSIGYFCIG